MPTITTQVSAEVDVDLDVEVFCADCGAGLCNQSDVRYSHRRGHPQITVAACANCISEAKEEGRREAEKDGGGE